jgi:hypothetical protein
MPSTYDLLRSKFLKELPDGKLDDGISKAENLLIDSGWKINRGMMVCSKPLQLDKYTIGEQIDARDYLVEEWDYDWRNEGEDNIPPYAIEYGGD